MAFPDKFKDGVKSKGNKGIHLGTSNTGIWGRVRFNDDVQTLVQKIVTLPDDHHAKENAEKFLVYYRSTNTLKMLNRFIASNNVEQSSFPSPDSSNVPPNSALQYEMGVRRIWWRFLHYPGLITRLGNYFNGTKYDQIDPNHVDAERARSLAYFYSAGAAMLLTENRDNREDINDNYATNQEDKNPTSFDWMKTSRHTIRRIIEGAALVAFLPPPSVRTTTTPPLPRKEQFGRNLETDPTLSGRIIQVIEEHLANFPFERLILDLISKEDAFENMQHIDHLEDMHASKRVAVLDEVRISRTPEDYNLQEAIRQLDTPGTFLNDVEEYAYKILGDTAAMNRQRRNFRVIRDWNNGRPWQQIIQLYDSSAPENRWLNGAIREFNQKLWEIGPHDSRTDSPITGYKYTGRNLFGFYPMDRNPNSHNSAHWWNLLSDAGTKTPSHCSLCKLPLVANAGVDSTIVLLNCAGNHLYHINCIFPLYWDKIGRHSHQCPDCRTTTCFAEVAYPQVGLRAHDPAFDPVFEPFVHNNTNYATTFSNAIADHMIRNDEQNIYAINASNIFNQTDHDPEIQADSARIDPVSVVNLVTELQGMTPYWEAATFPYGATPTMTDPAVPRTNLQHQWDMVADQITTTSIQRGLGQNSTYRDPTGFPQRLRRATFMPSTEAKVLREFRRRRNARRYRNMGPAVARAGAAGNVLSGRI